jgi:hypothetical protein
MNYNIKKKVECNVANFHNDLLYCSWMDVHDDIYSYRINDSKYYRLNIHYLSNDCGIVHIKNGKLSMRRKLGNFTFKCTELHCLVPLEIGKLMVNQQSFEIPEYLEWYENLIKDGNYPKHVVKCIGKFYKTAFGKN